MDIPLGLNQIWIEYGLLQQMSAYVAVYIRPIGRALPSMMCLTTWPLTAMTLRPSNLRPEPLVLVELHSLLSLLPGSTCIVCVYTRRHTFLQSEP